MFSRLASHLTFALLMALPLMAEPLSQAVELPFKDVNLNELSFRGKDCGCKRRHKHKLRRHCKHHHDDPPADPAFPSIFPSYASFVSVTTQNFHIGSLVSFEVTSVNDGTGTNGTTITHGVTASSTQGPNDTFTIQIPGDYVINLGLNVGLVATPAFSAQILKNGVAVTGGQIGGVTTSSQNCPANTTIMLASLAAGDIIQVQATLPMNITSQPVSNGQTAYISFTKLGPLF